MQKQRVYVETSIPSAYFDTRAELRSQRHLTRIWWDYYREFFGLCTSEAVTYELERAPEPKRSQCMALLRSVPRLEWSNGVTEATRVYVAHKVMPNDLTGDALHLAFASVHRVDYVLTWNCKHLANASKFRHIERINTAMGLFVPVLTTPPALTPEEGL